MAAITAIAAAAAAYSTVSGKKCSSSEPKIATRDATPLIATPHIAPKRPPLTLISANQVRCKELTSFERGEIAALARVNLNSNQIAKVLERPRQTINDALKNNC